MMIYTSTPVECITQRTNPNINYGLEFNVPVFAHHSYRCAALTLMLIMGEIGIGQIRRNIGTLYFPLNFSVNLKPLQKKIKSINFFKITYLS